MMQQPQNQLAHLDDIALNEAHEDYYYDEEYERGPN